MVKITPSEMINAMDRVAAARSTAAETLSVGGPPSSISTGT